MNRFIAETFAGDYRVTSAFDGRDGLDKALLLRPDLIVSDVMMPEFSGDQLVNNLRTHPELDTVPIIILTAKADEELRLRMLREGVQDYLIKPFSVEELRTRVGNLVAMKRTRDVLRKELSSQSRDLEHLAQECASLLRREQESRRAADEANRLKDGFWQHSRIVAHSTNFHSGVVVPAAYCKAGWKHARSCACYNRAQREGSD